MVQLDRRQFVHGLSDAVVATVLGSAMLRAEQPSSRAAKDAVDHLLLGVADREAGIRWVEQKTGVRAVIGGSHPGVGTCNALLSLGGRQYLEIIAPDPEQSELAPQYARLKGLKTPRLITWAAAIVDPPAAAARFRAAGFEVFGPNPGSRQRPDGKLLRWTTLAVKSDLEDVIPFFIEWDRAATHPSSDSPSGCGLQAIELAHPRATVARETLLRLGIDATVKQGEAASLTVSLQTPAGSVRLT